MQITVVRGDITKQRVDAVVTAANQELRGGGGVDGAVHKAVEPQLLRACRPLAPCPAGSAVVTPAFDLAAVRWVIHAVGPKYRGRPEDAELLVAAYEAALVRADEVGARSVAFPSISTGSYAYPVDLAEPLSGRGPGDRPDRGRAGDAGRLQRRSGRALAGSSQYTATKADVTGARRARHTLPWQ